MWAFTRWDRFPDGRIPSDDIPALAPDLAVEILVAANAPGEMARKRREYFAAGVCLVWEVDMVLRSAAVFTSPETIAHLSSEDALSGNDVLPGFSLPLAELFAELDAHQ